MKKLLCCLSGALLVTLSAPAQHIQPAFADPYSADRIAEAEKQAFLLKTGASQSGNLLAGSVASANFHINFYRCAWTIDPAVRYISGSINSFFTITQATDRIVFDLSDTLTLDSVLYHGLPATCQRINPDGLQIQFPATLQTGQQDSLAIFYRGVPRVGGGAFTQSSHNGVPVLWTLSEPYGAKEWWPCRNGLDDKADSIDIILTIPSAYQGATNGVLLSEQLTGSQRALHFRHRHPIASYLAAIAVTNYTINLDSVQFGNKTMPVVLYAYPEYLNYYKNATRYAKQALVKFSELFGEYPFSDEHYAQTEWSAGSSMEHQTNSFIGTTWNQVVAHELAHQWFGDMVTCGSWQDIWLNEGFANYAQFIFVQYFDTSLIMAHLIAHSKIVTSQPGGSVFVTDTSDVARIFDSRLTYSKSGYVIHMLRGLLGDSLFFLSARQYLNDPTVKNGFARTADLQHSFEKTSGKDLKRFFRNWIYGEGYPSYSARWYQNNNNWVSVQLNQSTSHPSVPFYAMPVQLEFRAAGRDTTITVDHQLSGQVFWINPGFKADTMMIDPRYWILAGGRGSLKVANPATAPDDVIIYPNPAPEAINISYRNPTGTQLSVMLFNAAGQLVFRNIIPLSGSDMLITIPTSNLARGMLMLKLVDDKRLRIVRKIIR